MLHKQTCLLYITFELTYFSTYHLRIIVGELFAQCPVDAYPGVAVEQVMDSSRYFVLKIQDGSGRFLLNYSKWLNRLNNCVLYVAILFLNCSLAI